MLGFTSIDDVGQEGAELAFDNWLAGEDGAKRVIQDSTGRKVEDVESIRPVRPGRDLALSLDLRIQYMAYRELKSAILENRARAGSVVVIDIDTGEVLAMVNQPAYNPNDRDQMRAGGLPQSRGHRSVRARLEHQAVRRRRGAGLRQVQRRQRHRHQSRLHSGRCAPPSRTNTISAPSTWPRCWPSPPTSAWPSWRCSSSRSRSGARCNRFGFGQVTTSGFPGESAGVFTNYSHWRAISIATLSHGYGISVTPLQLAQAYAAIGALRRAPPGVAAARGCAAGRRAHPRRNRCAAR